MSEGEKRSGKSGKHVGVATLLSELTSGDGPFSLLAARQVAVQLDSEVQPSRFLRPTILPSTDVCIAGFPFPMRDREGGTVFSFLQQLGFLAYYRRMKLHWV